MPRSKLVKDWKPDGRGRYQRMVGWREETGERIPQPFYLGSDLEQAKYRYHRVKELWTHLARLRGEEPVLTDLGGEPLHERREYSWDDQGLWIARELAAGKVRFVLPRHQEAHESTYFHSLYELARKYPMVSFVPEDGEAYEQGQALWNAVREHQKQPPTPSPLPLANSGPKAWGRLHEALDGFILHVKKTGLEPTPEGEHRLTAFRNLKVEQARRIKARQKDRPLSALDFHGCQELLDYWRLRPRRSPATGRRRGRWPGRRARTTSPN